MGRRLAVNVLTDCYVTRCGDSAQTRNLFDFQRPDQQFMAVKMQVKVKANSSAALFDGLFSSLSEKIHRLNPRTTCESSITAHIM